MKEFIFTWSIENISYSWHKTREAIISSLFTASPIQNSVWRLELYPRGYIMPDYLSLYLHRDEDNGPVNISINFEFSCISAYNSALHSYTFFENDYVFTKNSTFGHPRFMARNEVFSKKIALYLPLDVLTLRCRMWQDEGNGKEFGQSFCRTHLHIERIISNKKINTEMSEEDMVFIHSEDQNKDLISINTLQIEDSMRIVIKPLHVLGIMFSVLKLTYKDDTTGKKICEHMSSWLGTPEVEIWHLPLQSIELNVDNENSVENSIELFSEFVYPTGELNNFLESDNPNTSRLPQLVSKYIISFLPSKNISDSPTISQDLWSLHVDGVLCDVELKTITASFFVHEVVLCGRSPVFLAMLTGDMKEKENKCVEIEDIADDVLDKFIFFLYTDAFQDLEWEAVISLYYIADKYQVERLKILCCSFLLKNIDIHNVCEILMLADKHHDSDFRMRVEDFILENDVEIFSSPTWKQFVDEQPFLPAKTMLLKYNQDIGKRTFPETYDEMLSKLPTIQDDLTVLYKNKIITDIEIKCGETTYHAHKSILSASSIIIREWLTKDLKRKPNDVFEIEGLEDDIVSQMMLFLYTDSLEDVQWDTAMKLYHAADVYQIPRLKIKCSRFLLENIEISNASNLLLFAHQHRDANLKSVVKDFILMHDEEIFGSDEWADFCESNIHLANETMRLKYRKTDDF